MSKKTKYFYATIATAVVASSVTTVAPTETKANTIFPDVKSTSYYFDAVKSLSERNIISGYPNGNFGPNDYVTRGQAAKIIAGVLRLDTKNVKNPKFTDVSTNHPYYGVIAALQNEGIINGTGNGKFQPNDPIKRNHMAKIISIAFDIKASKNNLLPFKDVNRNYENYIAGLYEYGITSGTTATTFAGDASVTRGELAVFIHRAEDIGQEITIENVTSNGIQTEFGNYPIASSLYSIFNSTNADALKGAVVKATIKDGKITKISSLTLNSAGTASQSIVLDGAGSTLDGNLFVNADNIQLKNLKVQGQIKLSDKVAYSFIAENVESTGELVIEEGKTSPVASLNLMVANTSTGPKIELKQSKVSGIDTKRNNVQLNSDTKIPYVNVSALVSSIEINSDVDKVTVDVSVNIEIKGSANIAELSVDQASEIALNIAGDIKKLLVENKNSKVEIGVNLSINQLIVPNDSDAASIVKNFDAIKHKIEEILNDSGQVVSQPGNNTGGSSDVGNPGNSNKKPELYNSNPENFIVSQIARYDSGQGPTGTEIMAYDAALKLAFVTNGALSGYDILSFADIKSGEFTQVDSEKRVLLADYGISGVSDITSIASHPTKDLIAISAVSENKTDNGYIVFATKDGKYVNHVEVGALPDMVTFTPDGTKAVVANEGEPSDDENYVDPEGSISIINVETFEETRLTFDGVTLDENVRVSSKGTNAEQLEPEYITVSADSTTAYVSMQENNAIATVDLVNSVILKVNGLGVKDHSIEGNELDAHNKDGINIQKLPLLSFHMPDAIDTFTVDDKTYIITPNEGDARDWAAYSEEIELEDIEGKVKLNAKHYAGYTQEELNNFDLSKLEKIKLTKENGLNANGEYEALYAYGGRSFSIIEADTMDLVFDSGSQFERIIAEKTPDLFNIDNEEVKLDDRSDNKGPEPETAVVGEIDGKTYAFVALERYSGIMVYDLTDVANPKFVTLISSRDFTADIKGDVSPEGLVFVPASESHTGKALVIATHEVSGTIAVYELGIGTGELPVVEFFGTVDKPKVHFGDVKVDVTNLEKLENAVIKGNLTLIGKGKETFSLINLKVEGNLDLTNLVDGKNVILENVEIAGDTNF